MNFCGLVAPYVGAWIETYHFVEVSNMKPVAPYVGAWIETRFQGGKMHVIWSHPTWVRGLKHACFPERAAPYWVAPYVGAWIETG